MRHVILLLIIAFVVAGIAYGVAWLLTGRDSGLEDAEPDGRAVPLPGTRPLAEPDIGAVRFDTVLRGYRMDQVDSAMRRTAYDIGYKGELINVLEAEIQALRDGRMADAETLRRAREGAQSAVTPAPVGSGVGGSGAGTSHGGAPAGDVGRTPDGVVEVDTPTEVGDPIATDGEPVTTFGQPSDTFGDATDTFGDPVAAPGEPIVDDGIPADVTEQAPSGR